MPQQKGVSTLVGIIIIIIAAIILVGGAFVYQYFLIKQLQQLKVIQPENQTTGFPVKTLRTNK